MPDISDKMDNLKQYARWENNDTVIPIDKPAQLDKAGFPIRYRNLNIDTFPTETEEKWQFVQAVKRYIQTWKPHHNAILEGVYGAGKTGISISIGKELIKRGQNTRFVDCSNLAAEFSKDYKPEPLIKRYKYYDILILDDIDKASTEGVWKLFFTLINYRYNNMKCTIITTNVKLKDSTNSLIKPIYDRLQEPPSQVFTMTDWGSLREIK